MHTDQQRAILAIALQAAFADGINNDREREQIRNLADTLGGKGGADYLPELYQQVVLKKLNLPQAASVLTEPEHRQLAYEMAVCVCDADGNTTDAERKFLGELASVLHLDRGVTEAADRQAESLAELTGEAAPQAVSSSAAPTDGPVVASSAKVSETEIDRSVLNHAILNGALELLPQSWASMAIIPIQIKLVYGIGKQYGYELDQGHIRELMATLGVGLTSQYLEQFGRKLLGGLLGAAAGGLARQFGKSAASIAFSFATTYALGQVAKRYYAGGRVMNAALLQETFQSLIGPAKQLQTQYIPQIEQKASNLDMQQVMDMVRGV